MEQAFILPLPRYSGPYLIDEQEDPKQVEQMTIYHSVLDKLSEKKLGWSDLKAQLPSTLEELMQHPVVRIACDRNGQSLLHLAILQEQTPWVERLKEDPYLKQRRSHFGITPFELAQFLYKKSYIDLLAASKTDVYRVEPNISMGEQEKKFTQISWPIFSNEKTLYEVLKQSRKAKHQDVIPPEKIWMGIYFDKEIRTGLNPRLSVRYIDPEIGYGVFSEQKIPSCSFVGEYVGMIKERRRHLLKDKIYCMRYNCWQGGRRQFIIDAETHGNYTRFINHSAQPNLALQSVYWRGLPRMIFISLKEIPEGTQLTFDYGRSFWKEVDQEPRNLHSR
ncbi:MAG: SET domain-containing protein [Chlamydiales bacterium]|nr:SET domain-containing protein [Chlamydiales bacterium]